jgi:hypothetical protein
MVFVIGAEVISQPADTFGEESHLYFSGAGVPGLRLVLPDYLLLGRGV